jgi:thioredoxin 1
MLKSIIIISSLSLLLASCTNGQNPTAENTQKSDSMNVLQVPVTNWTNTASTQNLAIQDTMKKTSTWNTMNTKNLDITRYREYEANALSVALKNGNRVALFFHASWCPSCRSLDKTLTELEIPSNTVIFKVDYDTSEDLKKKYQVTSQHTTVVLAANGTLVSKKLGAKKLGDIFE